MKRLNDVNKELKNKKDNGNKLQEKKQKRRKTKSQERDNERNSRRKTIAKERWKGLKYLKND